MRGLERGLLFLRANSHKVLMENNRDLLWRKSEEIIVAHQKYLEYVYSLKWESRDQVIARHYEEQLLKSGEWAADLSSDNQDDKATMGEKSAKFDTNHLKDNMRDRVMEQLRTFPERKEELIREFLLNFQEIGKPDLEVLLQAFRGLSIDQLEKEFENICTSFHVRENIS